MMDQPSDLPTTTVASLASDGALIQADSISATPSITLPANGHLDLLQQSDIMPPNMSTGGTAQSITAGRFHSHIKLALC
jgi:hypothetical protein